MYITKTEKRTKNERMINIMFSFLERKLNSFSGQVTLSDLDVLVLQDIYELVKTDKQSLYYGLNSIISIVTNSYVIYETDEKVLSELLAKCESLAFRDSIQIESDSYQSKYSFYKSFSTYAAMREKAKV